MNFSKEQLAEAHGMRLPGIVSEMDSSQFDEYKGTLFAFTENFPIQEAELKNSYVAKDFDTFSKILLAIQDVLEKIQAIDLTQSCRKLLDELNAKKHDIIEEHLSYLLTDVATLSIDIQMAQHLVETSNKAEPKPISDVSEGNRGGARPKTILAVDDVSFLLMGLKAILQNAGYRVTGVTSGEAALKYIERCRADLFILDIEMPQMNGYELTEKLRKRGQTAPIIFLTGNATRQYVRKAIEVGAADFIVKPVNKEQVLEKIKLHLG